MSANSTDELAERLAALNKEFDVLRSCPTPPPGEQFEKYKCIIEDLNRKINAFRATLDTNPQTDVKILTVFQDFTSLRNKFDQKLADLSKTASLINESICHDGKLANMEPLGGGRSIRKKSAPGAEQQVLDSTLASKSADEMLQGVAAVAQSQPPVQFNINQQLGREFSNIYQVQGIFPMMPYMPSSILNTWMDGSFADSSTQQQFLMNPYPYMYNQHQGVYSEQYPILFQPPVEVVDLSDSDDEVRTVERQGGASFELEQSITAKANTLDEELTVPPAEPVPKETSEESMIEVLTKLGYNVSKSNESTTKFSEANHEQFSACTIQIEDVTSLQNSSPPIFTNNEDLLMNDPDCEDSRGDCNGIPIPLSSPDSPISPSDLREFHYQMPKTTNVAAKRLASRPSNKPTPARQSQHSHNPSVPSPQKSRSVSFCSNASSSKHHDMDESTHSSPLDKIYDHPKLKISTQEYKQRQQFGGSQNGVRPRPPVDLMKQYFTDQGVSQSKSETGHISSRSKPLNALHQSPTKLKASAKPEKIKAPVKSILKKPDDVHKPPVKSQEKCSAAGSSRDSYQDVAKKPYTPEIFALGPKTPLKSPIKKSPEIVRHNKEYYYKVNNEDETQCCICKMSFKHITRHFKDKHSALEVLISRISTADLQLAEEDMERGLIPPEQGQFQCRICSDKITDLKHFKDHCTYHTGEYCYCCSECNFTFPYANDIKAHWLRLHSRVSDIPKRIQVDCIFPKPTALNKLFGYVCPVCHWLQLSKKNLERHMIRNHGNDCFRNNKIKQINMVMHLPDKKEVPLPAVSVAKKRGRKKKVVNYKEPALQDSEDEPCESEKKKAKVRSTPSEDKRTFVKHKREDDNCACLGCGEIYSQTTKTSDWLECIRCKKWLHSDCSPYKEMCVSCGIF